jgi:hypothetical protein
MDAANLVFRCELQSVATRRKVDLGLIVFAAQCLPRRQTNGGDTRQNAEHRDLTNVVVLGCDDQFTWGGDDLSMRVDVATPHTQCISRDFSHIKPPPDGLARAEATTIAGGRMGSRF